MRQSFLASVIVLTFALLASRAVAAEPKPLVMREFIERKEAETEFSVPESIQKDMCRSASTFLETVYPDVDKGWMRDELGKWLLKDHYGLQELNHPRVRLTIKDTIQLDMTFPWRDDIEVRANRARPGVAREELDNPLTLQDAESQARQVLERLAGGPEQARRFELRDSRRAQSDWDDFRFFEFAQSPGRLAVTDVYFHIRRSNGLVLRCEWNALRLRPAVPYEKIVEMAKAAGRTEHAVGRRNDIVLQTHYYGGVGTLIWEFVTPPGPGGARQDDTWWDATTGELIYSMVLHGGTPDKPYRNPQYFVEVNDALLKRNIEKSIQERVAELEKK